MRMSLLFIIATMLQPPQDPSIVLELGKLKGTWSVVSLNIDGKDKTQGFADVRYVFSGQLLTLTDKNGKAFRQKNDGKVEERKFKLNVESNPKAIDLMISEKFQSLGIYLLEGDKLTMCTAEPGLPRPSDFKGKIGISIVVLKREK
jgi:uncharacterized protein (TIGR03067 family)